MNLNQYQKAAMRTAKPPDDTPHTDAVAVLALGLAGEAGEVADLVKKWLGHGHALDPAEVAKELGDVLWYVATLADIWGLKLDDVAQGNIAKLEKRYPEGFSHERSRNRTE